jgi:hypothetical protein
MDKIYFIWLLVQFLFSLRIETNKRGHKVSSAILISSLNTTQRNITYSKIWTTTKSYS